MVPRTAFTQDFKAPLKPTIIIHKPLFAPPELILIENVGDRIQARVCNLSDFLSNRQMAVLVFALTALSAVVVGGLLILTNQLFEARLARASAVHIMADTAGRTGPASPLIR